MSEGKVYRAIGLMSGTSLDGVDAAFLETDGDGFVHPGSFVSLPYTDAERLKIRAALGKVDRTEEVAEAELLVTEKHAEAVKKLGQKAELIGFHGQTIYHNPAQKTTIQIGDPRLLAAETGMDVVFDFRKADVKAGGQGAPLLPLYHAARVKADNVPGPVAVLNIGGVANVTFVNGDDILAFDTGPGNALIDDWVKKKTGSDFDAGGVLAGEGKTDKKILEQFLAHPYFKKIPPKSLDRDQWDLKLLDNLSPQDGAATLAAFTVEAVKKSLEWLPEKPRQWLVTGGGRHNDHMMEHLRLALSAPVNPVENVGWDGDALEAEGFAYLAVRSVLRLPLSLPTTTGVPEPLTGGVLYKA